MRFFSTSANTLKDRMLNAFLSQAVADAFSYSYEFKESTLEEVASDYDSNRPISITDDTQLAMFGLYAIGDSVRSGNTIERSLVSSYIDWYATQRNLEKKSWLAKCPSMNKIRAPGNTCMSALANIRRGKHYDMVSKGNGAVMRTLPFVFLTDFGYSAGAAIAIADQAGKITHLHNESQEAVDLMVNMLLFLRNSSIADAKIRLLAETKMLWKRFGPFMSPAELEKSRFNTFTALPAYAAAVTSVCTALETDAPMQSLLNRVCIPYCDSDTIAAIGGAMLGMLLPPPVELVNRLVERDTIVRLVDWTVESINVRPRIQSRI